MEKDCENEEEGSWTNVLQRRQGFEPGRRLLYDHWSSTHEHLIVVADVAECYSCSLGPVPLYVWVW